MDEQLTHRAKAPGYKPGWLFLTGIAMTAGIAFGLWNTFATSTSTGFEFWWLFAWLLPVVLLGRFATAWLEKFIKNESSLGKNLNFMKQAQKVRPQLEIRVEKVTIWFTYAVVLMGLAAGVLGWLYGGLTAQAATERFMTVLLMAAPQALLLAIPTPSRVAAAIAASHQIYYSNREQFDALGSVDMVVFDKTGTLTTAERRFMGAHLTHGSPLITSDDLLALAAGVEAGADHPIALAITEEAKRRDLVLPEVRDFRLIPGQGSAGTLDAQTLVVGGPIILTSRNMTLYVGDLVKCDAANSLGHTVLFVIRDTELLGWLELGDHIRGSSKNAVHALQFERKRVGLMTGDAHGVAASVAKEIGITEIFPEVLPHQKAEVVSRLQADTSKVAMVGDGVNDAQALQQANVGVAFAVEGFEPVESAGIMIASTDPLVFSRALILSAKAKKKTGQNLGWAITFSALTLPLAAGALSEVGFILSPAIAAGLSLAMSILILLNSRSLRRG